MTAVTIGVLFAIAVSYWLLEEPLGSWPILRLLSPYCGANLILNQCKGYHIN